MTSVEQSYAPSRIGRPVLARLWLMALAMFVVGTNAFVMAGVLPDIARDFGTSTSQVSTSITWYAAVVAIASPLVATFLGNVPRRLLLTTGMALVALGIAITSVAGDLDLFIAGRIVAALGGAALVPPATAAAPALVEPHHRGRAIAVVAFGFAGAVAFGSPLGSALATAAGWRVALGSIAALAAVLAVVLGLTMSGIPRSAGARVRDRFAVLADRRILLVLGAMVGAIMSFNVLYLFSAEVLAPAVGSTPGLLAVVLLAFGVASIAGTWLGGRAVDRVGGWTTTVVGFLLTAVVYAVVDTTTTHLAGVLVLYAVWGLVAQPPVVGIQDLLVEANPNEAGVTLSWYSTAMYVGIALAPVAGGAAVDTDPRLVPIAAMVVALVAAALVLGARPRRRAVTQPAAAGA